MSNLLASLSNSGNALNVFQQALTVVQNNVNNASTPGYAKQRLALDANSLIVTGGLTGGVSARGLQSSRDEFAEEEVQRQTQSLGRFTAQSQSTSQIESFFDVSGETGLAGALNNLFQSFSAWSVTPGDQVARQTVLSSADALASQVRGLANSLSNVSRQLDGQIGSTVQQINGLTAQIQQLNVARQQQTEPDPGTDAQLHAALDSLSQLTNFTAVQQTDGTTTILLAGGSPLVVGTSQYPLKSSTYVDTVPPPANPQSPPAAHILDAEGNDVTAQIDSGQLGGLLDVRNRVLGSIRGDAQQAGSLNQFAQNLADTVNQILESGTVSSAPNAAAGVALFSYDNSDATNAAATLSINSAITPDQLAPVDSNGAANGNAIQLASLLNASSGPGTIGGLNMVQYFAQIAAGVGLENQNATANQQSQQQVVAQATTLRAQISGVSLDEEAVNVLQFQRAYQAAAQVLTVLNTVTETTLSMIR